VKIPNFKKMIAMEVENTPLSMVMEEIAPYLSEPEVLEYMVRRDVDWRHVQAISLLTHANDGLISDWLGINVKTLREYRKPGIQLKAQLQEHLILLVSMLKQGRSVLGSVQDLDRWLSTPNFFLDGRSPATFLNTISGIRLVSDRLAALKHGDNV
jgi:putative toxin-antitoxin system antitoxin component (TIGR02293 family)